MNTSIAWLFACLVTLTSVFGCRTEDEAVVPAAPLTEPQQPPARQEPAAPPVAQEPAAEPAAPVATAPQDPQRQDPQRQGPEFLPNAFPPIVPDTEWHQDAWLQQSCLRCHETGVGDAPRLVHAGMPDVLLTAKCRTCHVFVPGAKPRATPKAEPDDGFAPNAFPPMMPASDYHANAWTRADCMLCHESGVKGAPRVVHEGLPRILLQSKCRSCHVQVRAAELDTPRR